MITGAIKSQIDQIWNAFWSGGISNPLEVMEQITYLLFLRRLDDLHTLEETRRRGSSSRWSAGSSRRAKTARSGPTRTSAGRASSISRRPRCTKPLPIHSDARAAGEG